jgi:hypothetical protein
VTVQNVVDDAAQSHDAPAHAERLDRERHNQVVRYRHDGA